MSRRFVVQVEVETDATDDELFAVARKTYEGYGYDGDEPIPTVEYAVTDIVLDIWNSHGVLRLMDTPPAKEVKE